MPGHVNVDSLTLDQKILGLATKHRFNDSEMNVHIEAQDVGALQQRACELICSEEASLPDKSKARMLEQSIAYMRRATHHASPEERIARHHSKMAGEHLNLSTFSD